MRFREADANGLETARCLEVLGQVLAAQGRLEAIPVAEDVLALRRAHLSEDDARIAASERGLAVALMAQLGGGGARAHGLEARQIYKI